MCLNLRRRQRNSSLSLSLSSSSSSSSLLSLNSRRRQLLPELFGWRLKARGQLAGRGRARRRGRRNILRGGLFRRRMWKRCRRSSVLKLFDGPLANVVRHQFAVSSGTQVPEHAIYFALDCFVTKFANSLPSFQMRLSFKTFPRPLESATV